MDWRRRAISMACAVMMAAAGGLLTAVPAQAAAARPADVSISTPAGPVSITPDKWPTSLLWAIPGSAEFNAKYTINRAGCGAGSDVFGYANNFIVNAGTIFDAVSKAAGGKGVIADPLTGSEQGVSTAPFPAVAPSWIGDSAGNRYAPGALVKMRDPADADAVASGDHRPCAADFAPFGITDPSSPFGFKFYPSPDPDTIKNFYAQRGGIAGDVPAAAGLKPPSEFWKGAWEAGHDFKVTDTQNYCADQTDPLCATAMFLHCPDPSRFDPVKDPVAHAAAVNCRIWNGDLLTLNAELALHVIRQVADAGGVGKSKLGGWALMLISGKQMAKVRHIVLAVALITAGVALIAGGLALGGILGAILLVAGLVTITGNWDKVWGAVTCTASLGKCLAKEGAQAMANSANLVAQAAAASQYPKMTGSTGALLNNIAGLSGVVLIIIFLLTLLVAAFTGKLGLMIPASFGLVRWGIAMGIGATVLTMAFTASQDAADAIAGGGGATGAMTAIGNGAARLALSIGGAPIVGWLLVAIVCILGAVAAGIVWVVITLSNDFIPLAIAVLILQFAGASGTERLRKWSSIGWSVLWVIMLLPPITALIGKLAASSFGEVSLGGLVRGVVLLLVAAVAPYVIPRLFPLVHHGGTGLLQGLSKAAGSGVGMAKLASAGGLLGGGGAAAGAAGGSRGSSLGRLLSGGGSSGGGGGAPEVKQTSGGAGSAGGASGAGNSGTGRSGAEPSSGGDESPGIPVSAGPGKDNAMAGAAQHGGPSMTKTGGGANGAVPWAGPGSPGISPTGQPSGNGADGNQRQPAHAGANAGPANDAAGSAATPEGTDGNQMPAGAGAGVTPDGAPGFGATAPAGSPRPGGNQQGQPTPPTGGGERGGPRTAGPGQATAAQAPLVAAATPQPNAGSSSGTAGPPNVAPAPGGPTGSPARGGSAGSAAGSDNGSGQGRPQLAPASPAAAAASGSSGAPSAGSGAAPSAPSPAPPPAGGAAIPAGSPAEGAGTPVAPAPLPAPEAAPMSGGSVPAAVPSAAPHSNDAPAPPPARPPVPPESPPAPPAAPPAGRGGSGSSAGGAGRQAPQQGAADPRSARSDDGTWAPQFGDQQQDRRGGGGQHRGRDDIQERGDQR